MVPEPLTKEEEAAALEAKKKADEELAKAPKPKIDDAKTIEDLKKGLEILQAKSDAGEIRGMSESTAHALLEEMKQFREELSKRTKETEKPRRKGFFDGF